MLNKIGYVEDIDFEGFKAFAKDFQKNHKSEYYNEVDSLYSIREEHTSSGKCAFGDFDDWQTFCTTHYDHISGDEAFEQFIDKKIATLQKSIQEFRELGGMLEIVAYNTNYYVIRYAVGRFIGIPKEFVVEKLSKDYSSIDSGEIRALLSGGKVEADIEKDGSHSLTTSTLLREEGHLKSTSLLLEKEEKRLKEEYELARQEMENKLRKMKEEHELALQGLYEQVEQMKDKVFLLQCNIFALRSIFGETFTLTQLKSGKTSNASLVLYQKFRYLDEEFVRLASKSFGAFDGSHGTTMKIFQNPLVQETFLPSDKCITFFRTSKDERYYAYDAEVDGLKALEYYHGSQVGMLIRNGENVWLSFIDEEINVHDNLFESNATYAKINERLDSGENLDGKSEIIIEGVTKLRDPIVKKGIDRNMLFFILDGLVRTTNIFEELKGVNLREPSDLVVFSAADNQIGFSKYPTFKEYFQEWDKSKVKEGDHILVVERGAAVTNSWGTYGGENYRNRGWQNRSRDAEDIMPGVNEISLIETTDAWVEELVNERPYKEGTDTTPPVYYIRDASKEEADKPNVHYRPKYKFYISSKRNVDLDWVRFERGYTPSRVNNVNLEVYAEDFCPIDFINSNYVTSWIDQKNIGDWYKGNYVYLVEKCFHALLRWCKSRESDEITRVRSFMPKFEGNADDLDLMLEWKKEHNVRNFTDWQAKRFVKWYKELEAK